MLQSRLIPVTVVTAVAVLIAGCANADGTDRGAIRENVIEPGITAIQQATELACSQDAANLRNAMETYELLEGAPAPDEAALVGDYLRTESELWDVVDGQLVAVDSGCESVATQAPDAVEITTSAEPPQSADELFAGFTAEQIAAVGGEQCARELAAIISGAETYAVEIGSDPDGLQQLVEARYLDTLPTLWVVTDDVLTPVDGSGCISLE
jgi:hypothetical protein